MKSLTTIGRILYALPFAVFGINHFIMKDFYMGEVTSFIPAGGYMILLVGVILILTSLSILTKKFIRISTLTLAGVLLLFILTIHIPHLLGIGYQPNHELHPDEQMITVVALLKDISLLGGSLMIAGSVGPDQKTEAK